MSIINMIYIFVERSFFLSRISLTANLLMTCNCDQTLLFPQYQLLPLFFKHNVIDCFSLENIARCRCDEYVKNSIPLFAYVYVYVFVYLCFIGCIVQQYSRGLVINRPQFQLCIFVLLLPPIACCHCAM